MTQYLASSARAIETWNRLQQPPPKLSLSEWADRYFVLSAESAAEPGRWKTYPFQRGIMDAITDPTVERVSVMKSARVGYTKCIDATIGYFMHQDPCSILVVQPTVDDAKGFSKEEIAPMIRDCPELARIIFEESEESGPKDSGNTILHKRFPGGVLSMVGANSGAGFRRISRRVVLFDEVDGYPPSAGSDGDQIKLGIKRTETFWNRKIIAGSTPLIALHSRIETLFEAGDRRHYYVPCPQCGHMDRLVFRENQDGGHWMQWPKDKPLKAYFVCSQNGCVIEHKDKRAMVARGEWRASGDFIGHASFHIWAAYSFSANASWGQLAEEFVAANKGGPSELQTFVNTVLGETWKEKGEAPDWQRIYDRREDYPIGSIPEGVIFLTAGVDVQKDRFVFEVVGWGAGKESWSIDSGVIPGDPAREADWVGLDSLLNRIFKLPSGNEITLAMLAVDAGYSTQNVYSWARRKPLSRVIATKGVTTARVLIGTPSAVDVKFNGKRIPRGYKIWPLGVDIAKAELYGWLRLPAPSMENHEIYPAGFCHFPEYGEAFFKQLTAEQLVTSVTRLGFSKREWQVIPGRENHFLDARVMARAAAALCGLDRMQPKDPPPPAVPVVTIVAPTAPVPAPVSDSRLQKPSFFGNRGPWITKR